MENEAEKQPKNAISPPDYSQLAKKNNNINTELSYLGQAAHPSMCVCTFIFKVAAIVLYFFLNVIINNATFTFVVILLISCVDFWTVKNLTGRFLVKLRWWSEI